MITKEYSQESEETSNLRLRITSEGYIILLISFILSLIGVLFNQPYVLIPGLTIQLSYLYFLWITLGRSIPEFDLRIEFPTNQVKAKQFLTFSTIMTSNELENVMVKIKPSSGIFAVLKPQISLLLPKSQTGSTFVLYTPRRGKEKIYQIELQFGGLPGLFYFTTDIDVNIDIIVLPQPQRVQIPWTLKQRIFDQFISEISISRRGRGDSFLSLRDFQFGDELRNIHWKATAKWGKLISKEFEEPIQLRFLIVVDRSMLMSGPKFEFALSSIIELCSVIRNSNHSCTILVHGNQSSWQYNLGTSPTSLNRLALLLHAIKPEGTYFNFETLNNYIKYHQLSDSVVIMISDLEQDPETVKAGFQLVKPSVQRFLFFACYTPGFSGFDFKLEDSKLLDLDQYHFIESLIKPKLELLYSEQEFKYSKIFSGKLSKFHLIEGYNTNILLELRDTLEFMHKEGKRRVMEEFH